MDANIPRGALPSEGGAPDAFSKVAAWARHAVYVRATRTFIEACEADGIAVLPVKGVISARTLYDDPAERPLTDVDVRVVPSDVPRVVRLCHQKRWQIVQRMRTYSNVVALVEGVHVDVEAHVGPPGVCNLHVRTMLERAQWSDMLGFRCRVPDFTDHAVLLMVNAFKDKLGGAFQWAIRDLERLPSRPAYDADALAARARDAGIATIAWVVASWMDSVRGSEAWGALLARLGEPSRPRYVAALTSELARDRNALTTRILARLASDSPTRRLVAVSLMAAWHFETIASRLGSTPYRRGWVPPWGNPSESSLDRDRSSMC